MDENVRKIREWYDRHVMFHGDVAETTTSLGRVSYRAWVTETRMQSVHARALLGTLLEEYVEEQCSVLWGVHDVEEGEDTDALEGLAVFVQGFHSHPKLKQAKQLIREAAEEFCADFNRQYGNLALPMYWAQNAAKEHAKDACQMGAQDAGKQVEDTTRSA